MRVTKGPIHRARLRLRSFDAFIRRTRAGLGGRRQQVTASVMAKNAGGRLPSLLSQLAGFADEIIVGVDVSSTDDTVAVARRWADLVYRFALAGRPAPARELIFNYATGEWILSIDDDELLDENFGDVVRDLASNPAITHAWFPRKWIVGLEPCVFAHAPLWYPDWQRRLFRNDKSLVHKPSRVHSGYWVSGPGVYETRACILHLEPIVFDAATRRKKLNRYNELGSSPTQDRQFDIPPDVSTRSVAMPKITVRLPLGRGRLKRIIHELPPLTQPGWNAEVLSIDCASHATPGELLHATIQVHNSGSLTWMPHAGSFPFVSLGNHLQDERGNQLQWDRDRFAVGGPVGPGTSTCFLISYRAPDKPGTYSFVWDMVSEGECWFADLGAKTLINRLIVADLHATANAPQK